jgi:hypothetical protein
MNSLEKIKAISLDPRSWSYAETLKAIEDIHQLASDEIKNQSGARNEAIDECINALKSKVTNNCDDHTPYYGACISCGRHDNPDVLPDPVSIFKILESLKY